jgi:hypothetical protein
MTLNASAADLPSMAVNVVEGIQLLNFRSQFVIGCALFVSLLFHAPLAAAEAGTEQQGWKPHAINDHLPDWASLTVEHRTRYEYLSEEFRPGTSGDHEILVLRTLINGRVEVADGLWFGAELEDSRAEVNDDTLLNTTIVNAFELLRAYVEYNRKDFMGGTLLAQGGRITMDLGSRRFVARNRYRNTINGFTGLDVKWKSDNGTELRGFWTLPVLRDPTLFENLKDNKVKFDDEDLDFQFWGLFAGVDIPEVGRGEVFLLGLHENDQPDLATRKRDLYTPGFRVFQKPALEQFDYQFESAFQFGRSRTSATAPTRSDHFAHFHHVEVGYTFDVPWSPRVVAQYDYASGDQNPTDGDNNRFDTQFGARRFDFGPTGIYGPFARGNLNTPGIRVQFKPTKTVTSFVAVRSYLLADRKDTWTSGLRDAEGKSGSYLGTQIEMRVRWNILPGNLMLEAGYAHLFDGEFIKDAPNSYKPGDLNYVYTQFVLSL